MLIRAHRRSARTASWWEPQRHPERGCPLRAATAPAHPARPVPGEPRAAAPPGVRSSLGPRDPERRSRRNDRGPWRLVDEAGVTARAGWRRPRGSPGRGLDVCTGAWRTEAAEGRAPPGCPFQSDVRPRLPGLEKRVRLVACHRDVPDPLEREQEGREGTRSGPAGGSPILPEASGLRPRAPEGARRRRLPPTRWALRCALGCTRACGAGGARRLGPRGPSVRAQRKRPLLTSHGGYFGDGLHALPFPVSFAPSFGP